MKHKTTTSARDPEAYEKLRDLVREIDIAMVTTVTPDGALRSRPMATREFTDDGEIWFFTSDDSGKAADLAEEHAVNVSYSEPKKQHYVSISGNATVVHDRDRAEELWQPSLKAWFPKGLDDPHLALICVRIETAEFWDTHIAKVTRLVDKLRGHTDDEDDTAPGEHTKVGIRATPASG